MKKSLSFFLLFFIYQFGFSQLIPEDSAVSDDICVLVECNPQVEFPVYSPEFVKDMLQCTENEVPLTYNGYTKGFINYFTVRKRSYLETMLERKELFFPMIEKKLAENNLPDELKYLAIIESGLNPRAQSPAGAVGLWQFIKSTGEIEGLNINYYFDERMNPEKATDAACSFLGKLYKQFGDWRYAIAAYNCGAGNVRKAKRKSGYSSEFWTVYKYLPKETRGYVPQFMAAMFAMENKELFYLKADSVQYPIKTQTVVVNSYCNIDTLTKELNLCTNELLGLNLDIKRSVILDSMNYRLKIPADIEVNFDERKTALLGRSLVFTDEKLNYKPKNFAGNTDGKLKITYVVKSGDYLGKIAAKYNVRLSDLKKWNRIRGNTIQIGQKMAIWKPESYFAKSTKEKLAKQQAQLPPTKAPEYYTVQPGDSLWDIARKFEGVTIETIKQKNSLKTESLNVGQKLKM